MEKYVTDCKNQPLCEKLGHIYPECMHGDVSTGRCTGPEQIQIALLASIAEKLGVNISDLKK